MIPIARGKCAKKSLEVDSFTIFEREQLRDRRAMRADGKTIVQTERTTS